MLLRMRMMASRCHFHDAMRRAPIAERLPADARMPRLRASRLVGDDALLFRYSWLP